MAKEKSKAQKELDDFRKTKVAYLAPEDTKLDFSKVDKPKEEDKKGGTK